MEEPPNKLFDVVLRFSPPKIDLGASVFLSLLESVLLETTLAGEPPKILDAGLLVEEPPPKLKEDKLVTFSLTVSSLVSSSPSLESVQDFF